MNEFIIQLKAILDLLNLIQKLSEYNIEVDFNPANFIMGENGKFGVIDLHTTEEGFLSLEQTFLFRCVIKQIFATYFFCFIVIFFHNRSY